jgi:hypothetical protein
MRPPATDSAAEIQRQITEAARRIEILEKAALELLTRAQTATMKLFELRIEAERRARITAALETRMERTEQATRWAAGKPN